MRSFHLLKHYRERIFIVVNRKMLKYCSGGSCEALQEGIMDSRMDFFASTTHLAMAADVREGRAESLVLCWLHQLCSAIRYNTCLFQ